MRCRRMRARDQLTLVTTEKDFARLRGGGRAARRSAARSRSLAVTLEFADAAAVRKFLADRLFKAREKKVSVLRS